MQHDRILIYHHHHHHHHHHQNQILSQSHHRSHYIGVHDTIVFYCVFMEATYPSKHHNLFPPQMFGHQTSYPSHVCLVFVQQNLPPQKNNSQRLRPPWTTPVVRPDPSGRRQDPYPTFDLLVSEESKEAKKVADLDQLR